MGSNTAERWWVRWFARWQARIESVNGQLNLAFSAMSGIGIASGALKYYNLETYTPGFIAATVVFMAIYAYAYSEGGVWNQTARDKTDLSTNYSGPTMLMDAKIEARQLAKLAYLLQNGHDMNYEDIETEMLDLTLDEWKQLRNGVDIEAVEQ